MGSQTITGAGVVKTMTFITGKYIFLLGTLGCIQGGDEHRLAALSWVWGDMGCLQAGGEGGVWATCWLSENVFLLGAGTPFLSSQGAMVSGSGWKSPSPVPSPCHCSFSL